MVSLVRLHLNLILIIFPIFLKELDNWIPIVIAPILVEVFNDQLHNLNLLESNKHGATRLVSKVDGIPLVTELRPITLLNVDYKVMTGILSKRIFKILHKVIRSPQSCGVLGANICTSACNLISLIEAVEKSGKPAAILSLDLFKA